MLGLTSSPPKKKAKPSLSVTLEHSTTSLTASPDRSPTTVLHSSFASPSNSRRMDYSIVDDYMSQSEQSQSLLADIQPHVLLKVEVINPSTNKALKVDPVFELRCKIKQLQNEVEELKEEQTRREEEHKMILLGLERTNAIQQQQLDKLTREKREIEDDLLITQQKLTRKEEILGILRRENTILQETIRRTNRRHASAQDTGLVYVCEYCNAHLFHKEHLIDQVSGESHTKPVCVVREITGQFVLMGGMMTRKFENILFQVKEVFCKDCLTAFGWQFKDVVMGTSAEDYAKLGKFCVEHYTEKTPSNSAEIPVC